MKWYQIILFIFMAIGSLKATEETSPLRLTEIIADGNADKARASDKISDEKDDQQITPIEPDTKPDVSAYDATESYESAFIKTIVVLVGLLALVILTVWMFRKISHGRLRTYNYMKSVKILEKRPLSPKSMLYLIEIEGKQVLIAESQLDVRPITTLDWIDSKKDL